MRLVSFFWQVVIVVEPVICLPASKFAGCSRNSGNKPYSEIEQILPLRTLNNVAWKSILEGIKMRDKSADDGTVSLTGVKLQGEIVGLIDEDSKNHGAPVMLRGAGDNREFAAAGQVMYMASPAVLTGVVKAGITLSVVLCIGWTCNHYQWSRDGYDIAGATGSEYLVTPQDVGKNIQCFVRHMLNNGWPASPDFAVLTALQPK